MKRTILVLVILFTILVPLAASGKVTPVHREHLLHTHLDGNTVYHTNAGTGVTTALFDAGPGEDFLGLGQYGRYIFVAINRGPEVTIQQRYFTGEVIEKYVVETENGNVYGSLFDMSFHRTGFWAVNQYILHYDFKTLKIDAQFPIPDGYTDAHGIAYDPEGQIVYCLLTDNSGLDRNPPIIACLDTDGNELGRISIPVDTLYDTLFGLGFDPNTQSLWFSVSFKEFFGSEDHLVNMSLDGNIITTRPIPHQYGSVECIHRR